MKTPSKGDRNYSGVKLSTICVNDVMMMIIRKPDITVKMAGLNNPRAQMITA